MKKMRKVISVLLAVIMVIGVLPAHSYGVETEWIYVNTLDKNLGFLSPPPLTIQT